MTKLSIFGCGWLGKALLQALQSDYDVKVSVQSQTSYDALSYKNKYRIDLKNLTEHRDFFQSDIVLIALPPRQDYEEILKKVLTLVTVNTQIVLLSSTSVYDQKEGEVVENSTKSVKNPSLMLKMEQFIQENHEKTLILRLGGLMGSDRVAGSYSAGKTLTTNNYTNLIHQDDAVASITLLLTSTPMCDVINLVAPHHPCKKELYDSNAALFSFEKTFFTNETPVGKRVSSVKLKEKYHYTFLKPNPLTFS